VDLWFVVVLVLLIWCQGFSISFVIRELVNWKHYQFTLHLSKDQPEDSPTNKVETCRWNYNIINYKVVSDFNTYTYIYRIIYILYYISAYVQHNGDVSLENYKYQSTLHP